MSKKCVCYIMHTSARQQTVLKRPWKSGVGQQTHKGHWTFT